ncbi:acyl-CoA N-acyltransferase [Gamsiella multidivaricata]|uniref:acyl-CoA N-acyltransferase n=1 Tax=Gamsiella multidivaricata TaxID=101098 RepID=UPI00222089FD|nr:acyl-CoA N-acyltransferase [Gamsiella multidivaricata]KAI7823178.1 acyl-CoA N-acyltransferase [Gamsiella multidivaricata]
MRPARDLSAMFILPWKAEASGGPDIPINDRAIKLTDLSGSRVCEPSRQAGVSEEQTTLFVREMKQFYPSANDDAVHSVHNSLEKEEEELKDVKIDAKLTITSSDAKMNTWFGFVSEGALFLRGDGWDDMDIRESVVAALDLAEEQLGCQSVHLCLEKSNPNLAKLARTLMYAGFEMVHPGALAHADPKYLVLGMDLGVDL